MRFVKTVMGEELSLMKEIERIIEGIYGTCKDLDCLECSECSSKLAKAIEQYIVKDIKKRIKSLRNRRSYIRRIDCWHQIGEPTTLRDIADYLQEELKKGLEINEK